MIDGKAVADAIISARQRGLDPTGVTVSELGMHDLMRGAKHGGYFDFRGEDPTFMGLPIARRRHCEGFELSFAPASLRWHAVAPTPADLMNVTASANEGPMVP